MERNTSVDGVFQCGTLQDVAPVRVLRSGALTAKIEGGALRALSIGSLELIRQIDFPVRDENWASLSATTLSEVVEEDGAGFRYVHDFHVAEGALVCQVSYVARGDGQVTAIGTATAKRDFVTNRTGFSVLHPLAHVVGLPVHVRHSTGTEAQAIMPDRISPSQPIKDIAGLRFDLEGVTLDIAFDGEVFEMEDQRNWSDASYKTYCRPLVEPFAYTIKAGDTLRQEIRVSVRGRHTPSGPEAARAMTFAGPDTSDMPQIGLAVQQGWFADEAGLALLAQSGLSHLLLRTTPATAAATLSRVAAHARAMGASVDLEIVLDDDADAPGALDQIATICTAEGLSPAHVTALPKAFLISYQPSSHWPQGLQPHQALEAARAAFPKARIGGGMLTNFTEFNRCPPNTRSADFITHGNSATVHAADDTSVMQTLEALPHIFRSARAIGGGCAYRLGLTAIGMRSNPYGACTTPNPQQQRLTMSVWDPRARALFGAAWAVGAMAATQGHDVEAIALAAPTGPFGIINTAADVPRPWFDDHTDAQVYPIFHVLRALRRGGARVVVQNVPEGLAAVAVQSGDRRRLVLANLTDAPHSLHLPDGQFAHLDADRFAAAARDPLWSETALRPMPAKRHDLAPYATVFGEMRVGH